MAWVGTGQVQRFLARTAEVVPLHAAEPTWGTFMFSIGCDENTSPGRKPHRDIASALASYFRRRFDAFQHHPEDGV